MCFPRPSKSYEYERQRRLAAPARSNLGAEQASPSNRQALEQGLHSNRQVSEQGLLSNRQGSEQGLLSNRQGSEQALPRNRQAPGPSNTPVTNRLMKDVNPRYLYNHALPPTYVLQYVQCEFMTCI